MHEDLRPKQSNESHEEYSLRLMDNLQERFAFHLGLWRIMCFIGCMTSGALGYLFCSFLSNHHG